MAITLWDRKRLGFFVIVSKNEAPVSLTSSSLAIELISIEMNAEIRTIGIHFSML